MKSLFPCELLCFPLAMHIDSRIAFVMLLCLRLCCRLRENLSEELCGLADFVGTRSLLVVLRAKLLSSRRFNCSDFTFLRAFTFDALDTFSEPPRRSLGESVVVVVVVVVVVDDPAAVVVVFVVSAVCLFSSLAAKTGSDVEEEDQDKSLESDFFLMVNLGSEGAEESEEEEDEEDPSEITILMRSAIPFVSPALSVLSQSEISSEDSEMPLPVASKLNAVSQSPLLEEGLPEELELPRSSSFVQGVARSRND